VRFESGGRVLEEGRGLPHPGSGHCKARAGGRVAAPCGKHCLLSAFVPANRYSNRRAAAPGTPEPYTTGRLRVDTQSQYFDPPKHAPKAEGTSTNQHPAKQRVATTQSARQHSFSWLAWGIHRPLRRRQHGSRAPMPDLLCEGNFATLAQTKHQAMGNGESPPSVLHFRITAIFSRCRGRPSTGTWICAGPAPRNRYPRTRCGTMPVA
jgi:hypothetical protein